MKNKDILKKKMEITSWAIKIWYEEKGKEKSKLISDLPDDVSQPIDDYLTEIENDNTK